MIMLRSDLGRESIELLRYELQNIIDLQEAQIAKHGSYLTATADTDLSKLKSAALINKARLETAQHLITFFDEEYLNDAIESVTEQIKQGEINE